MIFFANNDPKDVILMISSVPVQSNVTMRILFYSLLLTELAPPVGSDVAACHLARIGRLIDGGTVESALLLIEQLDPGSGSDVF
ncbi:MAG: hypothetical protein GDA36_13265, partial [Rhodobacteraceae bacterium]|nr:hypothetical protein [Paracoccaceae bacterium]